MNDIQMIDGLKDEVVLIVGRVLPGEGGMEERPVLVSVGVPEKELVVLSGALGQFEELWREGWANYARAQLAEEATDVGEVVASVPAGEAEVEETFIYTDEDF